MFDLLMAQLSLLLLSQYRYARSYVIHHTDPHVKYV